MEVFRFEKFYYVLRTKKIIISNAFHIGRYIGADNNSVMPFALVYINDSQFEFTAAAGVDTEGFTMGSDGGIITMEEFYNQKGILGTNDIWTTIKDYGIVEITEEKFYNMEV